ncbi:hypothetical protein ACF044_12080 [Microbacterium sp. NPDC016588]
MIGAVITWGIPAVFALLMMWGVGYLWGASRRRRRGEKIARPAGGTLGFDDVWRPSAAEAQVVWEAERMTPTPAPTPDPGPGVIDGNRIVITVATARHPD